MARSILEDVEDFSTKGRTASAKRMAEARLCTRKLRGHRDPEHMGFKETRLTPSTVKPEESEFVLDSGASMHMLSKKD